MPSVEEIHSQKPFLATWREELEGVIPAGLDVHGTPAHREFAALFLLKAIESVLRELLAEIKTPVAVESIAAPAKVKAPKGE